MKCMFNIAQQCPYAGGGVVYNARDFLRRLNDSLVYYDDAVCLQAGYYRQMNDYLDHEPIIKLIPNPTNNFVDIFSTKVNDKMTPIEIYNNIGELVYRGIAEMGVLLKRIDVTGFAPGVYSMKIQLENSFYLEKLVIIK